MRMQASLTCSVFTLKVCLPGAWTLAMSLWHGTGPVVLLKRWFVWSIFSLETQPPLWPPQHLDKGLRGSLSLDLACTFPLPGLLYRLPANFAAKFDLFRSVLHSPEASPTNLYVSVLLFLCWRPFHTFLFFTFIFVPLLESACHSYSPCLSVEI